MAIGNLLDDAALLEFVGDLAPSPLANRATGALRCFAGNSLDLADHLIAERARFARTRRIGQALDYTQVVQAGRLEKQPALAPEADRIDVEAKQTGNLAIVEAIGGFEHNSCTQGQLLRGRMAAKKGL